MGEKQEIKVGTKILRIIFENGRIRTPEIAKQMSSLCDRAHKNLERLRSRGLVKREKVYEQVVDPRLFPGKQPVVYWEIRPQKLEKVKRLIREGFGEDAVKK